MVTVKEITDSATELANSITDGFASKLSSPVYGVFVISWLIFHWSFVYTAFFVSEEKIWQTTGLMRNDYLAQMYFDLSSWFFYLMWLLPFVTTYLIIWHFPKWIGIPAFEKDSEYKTRKQEIEISAQKKLEGAKLAELSVATKRVKQEREVKKAQKEVDKIDPTATWEGEYSEFQKSNLFERFPYVVQAIYEKNGFTFEKNNYGQKIWIVPKDILAFSHTNDLVVFDSTKEKVELTDKGKFFVRKFTSNS